MTDYYELRIKINPQISEVVANICFENFLCQGIILAEETYSDLKLINTTEETLKVILTYIKEVEEVLVTNRETLLKRGFTEEELGSWDFEIIKIKNEDWSKKWKENWDVTHISEKIAVVPSWLEYSPKEDEIAITLDPGTAFGTGTHATTQLCMRAMEKYLKIDDEMADIGTGSGILAITAVKLKAASAVGIDNDELVIDTAKANAKANKACCKCLFICTTADMLTDKFDFICSNILHNVLADIMGDLKKLMKNNATLVLSGILDEKKQVVIDAIVKHRLTIVEEPHQDEWVAFVVKN